MTIEEATDMLLGSAQVLEQRIKELEAENRKLRAERNNRKKLTPREVQRIREIHRKSRPTNEQLADMFDVNPATISRIVRGIYHKGV